MESKCSIWENEADQTVELHLDQDGTSPVVAKAALGGELFWTADRSLQDQVSDEAWDEFEAKYSRAPLAVPSDIVAKLKKLAQMHEEISKLQDEITETLDARYDLGLAEDCGFFPPLENITMEDFVEGVVQEYKPGRNALYVDGKLEAIENRPGYYVDQHQGCCEDSYHGVIYLKLWGDGRYIKIPFET